MAEQEVPQDDTQVLTWDEWLDLPIWQRAEFVAPWAYVAQANPESMSPDGYKLLGLAAYDKELIGYLQQDSLDRNIGFDYEEAMSYEAILDSWRVYDVLVPQQSKAANEALLQGISVSGATDWQNFAPGAALAISIPLLLTGGVVLASGGAAAVSTAAGFGAVAAPTASRIVARGGSVIPAASRAAPTAGRIIARGGTGPVQSTVGTIVQHGSRINPATGTTIMRGGGVPGWLTNGPAGRGIYNALEVISKNHQGRGLTRDLLIQGVHNQGPSRLALVLRQAGSAAGTIALQGSKAAAGLYAGSLVLDGIRQIMASPDAARAMRELRDNKIKVAEIEKQGYQVRKNGIILAAGEDFTFSLEDQVEFVNADGNVATEEEIANLTYEFDVPDPQVDGATDEDGELVEDGLVPTTSTGGAAPPPVPVHGIATQGQPASAGVIPIEDVQNQIDATGVQAVTREDEIEAQQAARTRMDKAISDNPLIGVNEGYSRYTGVNPQSTSRPAAHFGRPGELDPEFVRQQWAQAEYRQNDVQDEISNMPNSEVVRFQERAIEAGLIDPESATAGYFRFGEIDGQTFDAMVAAMGQANINGNGQDWNDALDGMIENRQAYFEKFGDPNQPPTWSPPRAYFAPDYATISQSVKGLFGKELGRDPNEWEMELLADQFRADHRAQYDEDMAGSRAVFEADGRAQESGLVETPPDQDDIDPAARMAETFETQFSDELDAHGRWADAKSKSRNLFGSLTKLGGA